MNAHIHLCFGGEQDWRAQDAIFTPARAGIHVGA
jgi:hypothetical protein